MRDHRELNQGRAEMLVGSGVQRNRVPFTGDLRSFVFNLPRESCFLFQAPSFQSVFPRFKRWYEIGKRPSHITASSTLRFTVLNSSSFSSSFFFNVIALRLQSMFSSSSFPSSAPFSSEASSKPSKNSADDLRS